MTEMPHKTLFLVDHTFNMRESCGIRIEMDTVTSRPSPGSSSTSQYFPSHIPSVSRSLWTCAVEITLEYARILWDVYGDSRLFRVLLTNPQSTETLNEWDKCQQNTAYISEAFANAGPPLKDPGYVLNGIKSAISALQVPSELQEELMNESKCSYQIPNKGRVVCITSQHVDSDLTHYFQAVLNERNKSVAGSKFALTIQECEFTMITIQPKGKEHKNRISSSIFHEMSSMLKVETLIVSPENLYDTMIAICMRHHNLVVTTVTGIPMKEEQTSTSSTNYDVALLHPRLKTTSIETSVLKWSARTTQKGTTIGTANPCGMACRITPVNVISRQSTCLANFVISGRSVWLDMLKKGKLISHVLTSHGGEMWMHIIETSRNVLEDPPSISEGMGGRVTDYRITDFVAFMKNNMLIPYGAPGEPQLNVMKKLTAGPSMMNETQPNEMSKARLLAKSKFWPMTIGGSLLFPMALHIESLLNTMPRDTMTDLERVECESNIFNLMAIEHRGDPPPLPSAHMKKGPKRDDQWRSVFCELESFIRANLYSENHRRVLSCFLESRPQPNANGEAVKRRNDALGTKGNGKPLIMADSPMSPPPPKKSRLDESEKPRVSLLDLWRKKTDIPDLHALPKMLQLYANLRIDDKEKPVKEKRDRQD